MKKLVRNIPAALSLVLLAAHFLRWQSVFLAALNLGLTLPLFLKNRRLTQLIRLYLVLGAVLWVHTAFTIVTERREMGLPFAASAIILGSVALFTLASALAAAPG